MGPEVTSEGTPAALFPRPPRLARPALHPDVLATVFAGGCLGGWARYATTSAWPTPAGGFPWSTLVVNGVGALLLAVVVVVAVELAPSRYLRPLVGTGFCGAFTTFSSVVVAVDRLAAHHHAATAAGYLAASIVSGLVLAAAGVWLARTFVPRRHRMRPERSRP